MPYLRIFILAAVAGAFISPSVASAAWKRQFSSQCTGPGGSYFDGINFSYPDPIFCPYDDDAWIPKNSLTTLNVHGDNNSSGTMAISACVKYWNATGGSLVGFSCGSASNSSGTTTFTVSPDISVWQNIFNVGHFAYIKAVPSGPGTGLLILWGWFSST